MIITAAPQKIRTPRLQSAPASLCARNGIQYNYSATDPTLYEGRAGFGTYTYFDHNCSYVVMNLSTCENVRNDSCDCGSSGILNECLWRPEVPYPLALVVIVTLIYIVILLFAVLWNSFVICIFLKERHLLREPSSLFLFSLAIVDLLEAVLSIPFYIATLIGGGWVIGSTDAIRNGVCIAVGFIFSMFLLMTVHLLALISFDRFLYLVYPLKYRKWMNLPKAVCLGAIVSVPPLILASMPFFGFGKLGFSSIVGVCIFRWEGEREYVITVAIEALLPIIATIVFTLWTYIHAKRFLKRRHLRQTSYGVPKKSVVFVNKRNQRVDRALTQTFILLLVSQVVCFTPGILTALVGFFIGYQSIPSSILIIDFVIIISSVGINPVIQSLSRTQIRHYLTSLYIICNCTQRDPKFDGTTEITDDYNSHSSVANTNQATEAHDDDALGEQLPRCTIPPYNLDPIAGTLV